MIQEMFVMSSLLTIGSSHRKLEFLDGSCGLNRRWAPCAHASILLPLLRYILCLLFLIYFSSMVLSMSADMCVHIFTDVMFAVYEVAFLLKNGIACHVCSKEIFLFLFFYNVGHNLYMFPFLTRPVPETFILIWSWWSLVLVINLKVHLSKKKII